MSAPPGDADPPAGPQLRDPAGGASREAASAAAGNKRPAGVGAAYSHSMGEAGPYLFIGIQIAGAMALFVLGGFMADRWLETTPWLTVIGAVLGMVAVVFTIIRAVAELDRQNRARASRAGKKAR